MQAARVVGDRAFCSGGADDTENWTSDDVTTASAVSKPKVKPAREVESARKAEVVSLCEACVKAGPLRPALGEANLLGMVCAYIIYI